MKKIFFTFLLLFLWNRVTAQNYNVKQYTVAQGLPTNMVKAINQDSLGFIWIATDDGLIKYDGVQFISYKYALKSKYVKGFLKTKQGRLLVIGDLDLIEIQNRIDTVVFKSILKGSYNETDSTISSPKTIYEDKKSNIWLAESESIVKYEDGKLKRFNFGKFYNSNDFNKSFNFFEDDNGNFYVVSYNGEVFVFNEKTVEFERIKGKVCEAINQVKWESGSLYIASNYGFYEAKINRNEVGKCNKILQEDEYVSAFRFNEDESIWVGTYKNDLLLLNKDQRSLQQILKLKFSRINAIYLSDEGDYWVSTDKGIVLLQKYIFKKLGEANFAPFVTTVVKNTLDQTIFFSDKESLGKIIKTKDGQYQVKTVLTIKNGNFQALQSNEKGLWASNAFGVLLIKNSKVIKKWDFSSFGHHIFDLLCDSKNNIWVAQSKSKQIRKIDPEFKVVAYELPMHLGTDIRLVTESAEGIYAVAQGNVEEYLFFKANNSDNFINLKLDFDFQVTNEFQILRMVAIGKVLWMATSHGLLKFENGKIERLNLGDKFTNTVLTTIAKLDDENLLFANSYGLFRYNIKTQEYWAYDENLGLPSVTITDHGIEVENNSKIWIGTSNGLAYVNYADLVLKRKTPKPICISAKINGISVQYANGIFSPFGAYIRLQLSSLVFPENKLMLQWKIVELEDKWQDLAGNEINFSELSDGKYTFQFRAKQNTGLGWSDVESLSITIDKPYWLKPNFIVFVIILIGIIIWLSYGMSAVIMNKRRAYLQEQIKIKTHDLELANAELVIRNQELDRFVYSASHDLGAPLKSLLGLLYVAKMEDSRAEISKYHLLMEKSIKKLDDFIKEVISYSRNSRMPIQLVEVDFEALVQSVLEDHQYTQNFQFIEIKVENKIIGKMMVDISRLKIILNNLISNAIKFHRVDGESKPFVMIGIEKNDKNFVLTVADNGKGIKNEYLDSIFEMFYRASVDVQGSGLGLYILKETIAKLNGTVNVTSEFGVGTTFQIKWPINPTS